MKTLIAHGNNIVEITTDEGITWTITYPGKTYDGTTNDGRIFISTDEGIKYSDDEGITWTDTEVECESRSLYNFKIGEDKRVYATTVDGITYTEDNGSTWKWAGLNLGEENLDNSNLLLSSEFNYAFDDGIVVYGDFGAVLLDYYSGRTVITTLPTYIELNGDKYDLKFVPTSLPDYDGTEEQIDKISTYLINNILYPYCSLKYTGYISFPLGEPNTNNTNNEKRRLVISDSEFWTKFKNESIIDWENDVGMGKIGKLTLSDILEESEDEDTNIVTDDIDNINNDNYNNTMDKIKKIVNDVRDTVVNDNVSDIESIELDGLSDIIENTDEDFLENDIKAYNIYVDAARKTNEVLCKGIINYVFNFDEYSLRRLIRSSLYEMVKSKSGLVKYAVGNALKNGEKTFNILNIGLKFNFDKAVRNQLMNYSREVAEASKKVDSDGDKTLIGIAASYYNNYERSTLIQEAISSLSSIVDNFDTSDITEGEFPNCIEDISNFISEAKNSDDRKTLYNNHTFLYKTYDYSKLNSIFYNKFRKQFENSLDDLSYSSTSTEYFNSSISGLEEARQLRIFKYINEINKKFKSRCLELLDYVYSQLDSYNFNSSSEAETIKLYRWVCEDDEILDPYFEKILNPKFREFAERILVKFNSSKESL